MENNFDEIFESQEAPNYKQQLSNEEYAAMKQDQRDHVFSLINQGAMDMITEPGAFQQYLDVQANFPQYSCNNAILVMMQRPDSTALKDINGWNELKASVQKGASSIIIMSPGKEYDKKDGTKGVNIDFKHVFDVSQTNYKKPVERSQPIAQRTMPTALMQASPCGFELLDEMPNGSTVLYDGDANLIQVQRGLDGETLFRGLAQAIAMAHMETGELGSIHNGFASYCVAYLQCKQNGVPTGSFRFDQLPDEFTRLDSKELRTELNVIQKVNKEIGDSMDRYFEVNKERGSKSRDEAR